MKATTFACLFMFFCLPVFSQTLTLKTGGIIAPAVTLEGDSTSVGFRLMNNVLFTTPHTYHNIFWSWKNSTVRKTHWKSNSIGMIHGWIYAPKQDVYVVATRSIGENAGYLGLGWSYVVGNGGMKASWVFEFGTLYPQLFKTNLISTGFIIPLQAKLWEKKGAK